MIIQKFDPLIIYQPDRRELGALRRLERSPAGDLSKFFPMPSSFLILKSVLLNIRPEVTPRSGGKPSGWMKQKEVRPLLVAAWDEWAARKGLDLGKATGRDTLQFYYDLQDAKSPLLKFVSRTCEKWQVIHDWLVSEQRVRL